MKKFIEVELKDGKFVSINTDHITAFNAIGELTDIHLVTKVIYVIKMDYEKFKALMQGQVG